MLRLHWRVMQCLKTRRVVVCVESVEMIVVVAVIMKKGIVIVIDRKVGSVEVLSPQNFEIDLVTI